MPGNTMYPQSFLLATGVVVSPVYTDVTWQCINSFVTGDDANCCRTSAATICSTLQGTYIILLVKELFKGAVNILAVQHRI
jgi:hypothetical protein